MISHLADKELLYKLFERCHSESLFIVKSKGNQGSDILQNYRRWLFATYRNYDSNLPIHDVLPSVTIILLRVKLNKMLNVKTKSCTFQILGREEFSKRTNAHSWEGCDQAKI